MSRRKRSGATPLSLFAFQDIITCVMGIMLLLTLMMSLQIAVSKSTQASPEMLDIMNRISAEAAQLESAVAVLEAEIGSQTQLLRSGALLDVKVLDESRKRMSSHIAGTQQELVRLRSMADAASHELTETRMESDARSSEIAQAAALAADNERLEREIRELQSGQRVIYNAHDSQSQNCWIVELSDPANIRVASIGNEQSFRAFADVQQVLSWIRSQKQSGDAFMLLIKPGAAALFDQISESLHREGLAFGFDLLSQDTSVLGQSQVKVRP